jgi:protein SCO1
VLERRDLLKWSMLGGSVGLAGLAGVAAGVGVRARKTYARSRYDVIPNVEVWTHEGRKVRFYDDLVKDKVVTLNAFFVGCGGSCPLITANLRRVQDLLGEQVGRDIFMYSITLQPELETPEILRDYAEQFEVRPGWQFLTGAPADIELLRRRLGFYDPDPGIDVLDDTHTGILRFGNDRLQRWAGCPALARPEGIVFAITSSLMV